MVESMASATAGGNCLLFWVRHAERADIVFTEEAKGGTKIELGHDAPITEKGKT